MILFEDAYAWLNYDPEKGSIESSLSQPTAQLKLKMDHYLNLYTTDPHMRVFVLNTIDRLLHVADDLGKVLEIAETRVECGRAYYLMNDYREAELLLAEAVALYRPYRHNMAIALWMLGVVLWKTPARYDDAIVAWQRCIEIFIQLKSGSSITPYVTWYDNRWTEAMLSLDENITNLVP